MKPAVLLLFLGFLFCSPAFAQLEKIIVETYYISDSTDATDSADGVLPIGSTTYRIYADMKPGSKLTGIYGDANHLLKIASTAPFFNNSDRGQTFGYKQRKIDLRSNTVALDSWITIGQTSTTVSKITYCGVPKAQDKTGSFIGGTNNTLGFLTNDDPNIGIPLTTSDGYDTLSAKGVYTSLGINVGTTIFDTDSILQFGGNSVSLTNSVGISGANSDSNQVLIAQVTTKGQLSFELNLTLTDDQGTLFEYVAQPGSDSASTVVVSSLTYPPACGCKDPNFLEYNSKYGCNDEKACKTPVVLGCMDPNACNYDPHANISLTSMCCYPGFCNNRDISLVCPTLGLKNLDAAMGVELFPNPAQEQLNVKIQYSTSKELHYSVHDAMGRTVIEENIENAAGTSLQHINTAVLAPGVYLFRLTSGTASITKTFIKN